MNSKSALRVMVMEGMEMVSNVFASIFNCWSYNPVISFYLCLISHVYRGAFQLVKKCSSLDVTVVLLMYMDKLVCSNSDIDQELIKDN